MRFWTFLAIAILIGPVACTTTGDDGFATDDDATGDDDESTGDDDSTGGDPDPEIGLTVAANPYNPFSALVELTADRDLTAFVEHGEEDAFDRATPEVQVTAGEPVEVLLLGLKAAREHQLRVVATDGDATWTSEPATYLAEPLAWEWPQCWSDFGVAEEEFDSQEAVCTHGVMGNGDELYYCIDRWGEPVFSMQHPDNKSLPMMRALCDGGWAALSESDSGLLRFDRKGELLAQWSSVFFQGLTRFQHDWIDMHDVIELTVGPWAGALAMVSLCNDIVDGENLMGSGIIVFDTEGEHVLWDWCAHGAQGDNQPIDPLLPYERELLADHHEAWLHVNAVLHGVDQDGGQFFWLSARSQDWLFKIDVETDEVVWRLGYGGDFLLVEDLEDPASPELPPAEWFFHQHAPEWVERAGARTRFLLLDNGNVRAAPDGGVDDADPYSRLVEFTIDEQTMRAAPGYEFGERTPGAAGHFFSPGGGDADMLPGEGAVMFVASMEAPRFISEASYPGAEERWRHSCGHDLESGGYRVDYFPTLYDLTWKCDTGQRHGR